MSFISYLINGISLGSVYALIALGYTMVYGIAKMLNFAHGDVIMVGAFITYTMCSTMVLPPLPYCLAMVITTLFIPITIPFCLCCFHPQRLTPRVIHPDMLS